MSPERRQVGPSEWALLAELRERGQATISLPQDRPLVERHSRRPVALLSQMAEKGLLRRARRGHYAVLGPGAGDLRDELPTFARVNAALASRRYAISFLSALAYYGLTDHEPLAVTLFVDLPKGGNRPPVLAGVPVNVRAQRRDDRWFGVRTVDEPHSFRIADPERAMVDSIDDPSMSGGPEVVVRALARGLRDGTLRKSRLIRYANRHSVRVARRVAYLLERLEFARAEELEPLRLRSRSSGHADQLFGLSVCPEELERRSAWRLDAEVSESTLRAWAAAEELA